MVKRFLLPVGIMLACSSSPATQFTVGVMSQIIVPKELRSIRITASVEGNIKFCQTYPVDDGKTSLPQSLALAPGGDPARTVTVTVVGFEKSKDDVINSIPDDCSTKVSDTEARILRRSRQSYTVGHNLFVPMPLRYSCMGVDCGNDQTCKGAKCVAPDIDPKTLPDFVPEILFNNSTCFDPDACLADAVGPTVIDAAQCIYEVPPGSSVRDVGMNVRAIYQGHGVEVLDLDPNEGFFLPDETKPNRFQLAPGVCHPAMGGRQVVNVNASRACIAKNVYQPLCASSGRALAPSSSALYVLMDHGSTMAEYVGASATPGQALDQVLKVALGDPVFSTTTKVGLKFIADLGQDCTPSQYATPDIGFDDVWKEANPIANFIQAAGTKPGIKLAADAALNGASVPNVTNTKALLLVTNRDPTDVTTSCGTALSSTFISQLSGKKVYVMSLKQTGENPLQTQTRSNNVKGLSSATVISAEGPDDASSQAAVLAGLGNLVSDLASCVYDDPGNVDPSNTDIVFNRMTVPHDAACMNGWNASGGVIRICGTPCNQLRQAIQLASQQTATKNATTPSQGHQVLVYARPK